MTADEMREIIRQKLVAEGLLPPTQIDGTAEDMFQQRVEDCLRNGTRVAGDDVFEVARRQVRGRYSGQRDAIVRVVGYDRV